MIPVFFRYATPSVLESTRDRTLLGMTVNGRRPVRFQGRVERHIPLFRFALRALGEVVWSNDSWRNDADPFILDPVITVHPARLFFEAFSQDQSAYGLLLVDPRMFAPEGEVQTGTTNVDFTAWHWAALGELRSSRETWLRIGAEGFEVVTREGGGRFEQKIDLPEAWVRGFLQLQAAMALPGTRLSVRPVDLLAAIRYARYTKTRLSPRALRYEFEPGRDAAIFLEPWEHFVPLQGAKHNYTEPRVIRTWGRRRLRLIEPLLPFAERVRIYLKGRALPSFYAVQLPSMTFVLGLSGWTGQKWTEAGSFDLLTEDRAVPEATLERVRGHLAGAFAASEREIAAALGLEPPLALAALVKLCRLGRAIYDVETRAFRHRELFEEPIDEARLYPPDPRRERAEALLAAGRVRVDGCVTQETRKIKKMPSPEGRVTREIIYRDWEVTGAAGEETALRLVVNGEGRMIFGTCGCAFFREHLLNRGPCEHLQALLNASRDLRRDLPTSAPVDPGRMAAEQAMRQASMEGGRAEGATDQEELDGDSGAEQEDA